jgi:hypothetical protein
LVPVLIVGPIGMLATMGVKYLQSHLAMMIVADSTKVTGWHFLTQSPSEEVLSPSPVTALILGVYSCKVMTF